MTALLLTLHLWQAPVVPAYQANLRLVPSASPAWLSVEPGTSPSAAPSSEAEWTLTLEHTAIEAVAAALGFGLGEGVLALVFYGLIAAGEADGGGGAGDTLLDVLAVAVFTVDLIAFPMLFVGGAWLASNALGLTEMNVGRGIFGAYLGTLIGLTILAAALVVDLIAFSSNSSEQSTALLDSAYASLGFVPMLGGIGAALGLHWEGSPGPLVPFAPTPPAGAPSGEPGTPPLAQPPPMSQPPPPPSIAAPPLPPSARIPLLTVHFG